MKDYIIKQIEDDEIPLLFDFYKRFFPEKEKLNNKDLWIWEFKNNPQKKQGIVFYIVKLDGTVHGAIGALPVKLQIDGNVVDACHPVNFFIDPSFKGLPAYKLYRTIEGQFDVCYSSYVSDEAVKLFKAAGYRDQNDHIMNYYYFLKVNPSLSIKGKLRSYAVLSFRRVLYLYYRTIDSIVNKNIEYLSYNHDLVEQHTPDINLQKLDQRVGIVKSYHYLKWRYDQSPELNCRYFIIKKNNHVTDLLIIHEDKFEKKAIILDIVRTHQIGRVTRSIMLQAINYYKQQQYNLISTTFMNTQLNETFKSLGFSSEKSTNRFIYKSRIKDLINDLSDEKKWDFHLGDTDVL